MRPGLNNLPPPLHRATACGMSVALRLLMAYWLSATAAHADVDAKNVEPDASGRPASQAASPQQADRGPQADAVQRDSPGPSSGATTGVLPSRAAVDAVDAPPKPKDILSRYGLGSDRLDILQDGVLTVAASAERDLLLQLALRFRRISAYSMEYWAEQQTEDMKQRQINMNTVLTHPMKFRGDVFHAEGRVVAIESIELSTKQQERFETKHLYRCRLYIDHAERVAVVYTTRVPKDLLAGDSPDARVSFYGLFLKRGPGSAGVAPLVFVAPRLAHHENTLLGDLGTDTGLLDNIQNGKPMQLGETECFYQMLSASRNAGGGELFRHAYNALVARRREWAQENRDIERQLQALPEEASSGTSKADLQRRGQLLQARLDHSKKHVADAFVPLMQETEELIGHLRMLAGTAHRIVRVRVTDPDRVRRFGITHYYQIDMQVNLEHRIKLVSPDSDGEDRISWHHPATFCALNLPEGMPIGDNVHVPIRVAGFYFKKWQYETEVIKNDRAVQRMAPMLIGRMPHWDNQPTHSVSVYMGAIAGGFFVLALSGIWFGVWRVGRSDDAFRMIIMSKAYGIEEGGSPPVDFGFLDDAELHGEELGSAPPPHSA